MKITVEPTEEFFEAEKVPVRMWKGTTDNGVDVVALIAGVRLPEDEDVVNLKLIPPPVPSWSSVVQQAMSSIWLAADRLSDIEAVQMLGLTIAYTQFRDPSCPEQSCARCERSYRGPGDYCCHGCAMAAYG